MNDWFSRNVGIAMPSWNEIGDKYRDTGNTIRQDFSAGRQAMATDFPVNPDTDPYSAARNTIAQGLGGALGVISMPLGRFVNKHAPKTNDSDQK